MANKIILHFATERMRAEIDENSILDIETLVQSNLLILENTDYSNYLEIVKSLIWRFAAQRTVAPNCSPSAPDN